MFVLDFGVTNSVLLEHNIVVLDHHVYLRVLERQTLLCIIVAEHKVLNLSTKCSDRAAIFILEYVLHSIWFAIISRKHRFWAIPNGFRYIFFAVVVLMELLLQVLKVTVLVVVSELL